MSTDINFLINENIYDLEDFTCIICQCLINNAVGIKCDIDIHIFCENCIKKWFGRRRFTVKGREEFFFHLLKVYGSEKKENRPKGKRGSV